MLLTKILILVLTVQVSHSNQEQKAQKILQNINQFSKEVKTLSNSANIANPQSRGAKQTKSNEFTPLSPNLSNELSREAKHQFKIGLIVPKTAFLSQYKTYTQRIKDTFTHLLQLSKHHHQSSSQKSSSSVSSSVSSNQKGYESVLPSSSCATNLYSQQKKSYNLTFHKYFDIKVVDLVNLAPRSNVHDIVESMCHKLIEQNVSVIVYLENNQDQTVTSLESEPSNQRKTQQEQERSSTRKATQATGSSSSQPIKVLKSHADGLQTSSQAHFIMHLANSAGIPTIAWSVSATVSQRPKKQRTLHLAPTVAHEAEAMLAIMQRYSWYSFSVVSTTLAGHEDFIMALRQNMASFNSDPSTAFASSKSSYSSSSLINSSNLSIPANGNDYSKVNDVDGGSKNLDPITDISGQSVKTFRMLDSITIKERSKIEEEIRQLTASESRVILLYATKGEAMDILRAAKKLGLTRRSYAWIVAQSVIGANENERAPLEFHPGLLGIYFRSNHERLLDELSRAITIVAHGLERFVRDEDVIQSGDRGLTLVGNTYDEQAEVSTGMTNGHQSEYKRRQDILSKPEFNNNNLKPTRTTNETVNNNVGKTNKTQLKNSSVTSESSLYESQLGAAKGFRQKLLDTHSRCYGESDSLNELRADLLYEYFRKSSPNNVFDADGSLKDVELNVVNLDNEHQWRKIGCFSDATLTIDDITWPEQAERPPSGTMEKFHLRAVFLEEPSFVNLAEPDTETGECKTNRAVRCRYKIAQSLSNIDSEGARSTPSNHNLSQWSQAQHRTNLSQSTRVHNDYEYKCCSGFCIDLMEKFAADLKFSYDLYRVPDGFWGILENNTWNGLIGEITRGRADVIVSSTKINSDRQKAVDFTVPFLDTGISILVGKQTGVIAKLAFLEPFDTLAWVMFICVGIPLAATSIFYFEWMSPNGFYAKINQPHQRHHSKAKPSNVRQHERYSFCRTLWLVITILFGSAAHIDSPKGYTARFMSNIWATFAVVFLAIYTANLAAFMITREEYLEFSGIGDARLAYPYYRHPPLKFGTITGGNTHAVLSANKPNLYSYMRRFNRLSAEDGVEAVKSGQLDAFVYDALVLDYLASQDPECKLVNVGAWFSMTGYALAFPRNSRYYEKFNMKMLEYRKNGELDRLRRFWLQGLCKPGLNRHSISKPLDLSQFMSAFLLLGAGILCSVLVLVCEHLYIIYVRERLIKSRHRKRLINWLYPFSLSLAGTLRLPDDDKQEADLQHVQSVDTREVKAEKGVRVVSPNIRTTFELCELPVNKMATTSTTVSQLAATLDLPTRNCLTFNGQLVQRPELIDQRCSTLIALLNSLETRLNELLTYHEDTGAKDKQRNQRLEKERENFRVATDELRRFKLLINQLTGTQRDSNCLERPSHGELVMRECSLSNSIQTPLAKSVCSDKRRTSTQYSMCSSKSCDHLRDFSLTQ